MDSGLETLLIATHNPGKLREYRELLTGASFSLVSLDDVGIEEDIEETGGSSTTKPSRRL